MVLRVVLTTQERLGRGDFFPFNSRGDFAAAGGGWQRLAASRVLRRWMMELLGDGELCSDGSDEDLFSDCPKVVCSAMIPLNFR